jgi:hypothetical protein
VYTINTPLLEAVEDYFGIRVIGLPAVTAKRNELGSNLGVVVNFSVKDHPQRAVFVAHRLGSIIRKVYDGQSSVPQT